jgi:hypothetical protein
MFRACPKSKLLSPNISKFCVRFGAQFSSLAETMKAVCFNGAGTTMFGLLGFYAFQVELK